MTNPNQTDITPEELKRLAEAVGKKNVALYDYETHGINGVFFDVTTRPGKYNPLTNNDQLVELIEWLIDKGFSISKCKITGSIEIEDENSICSYGSMSLKQAVIKAALEEIGE